MNSQFKSSYILSKRTHCRSIKKKNASLSFVAGSKWLVIFMKYTQKMYF